MTKEHIPQFKRIYFIGAGFSAGMGYPVGATLMSDLVQYLQGRLIRMDLEDFKFESSLNNRANRSAAKQIVEVVKEILQMYFGIDLDRIDQVDVAEFFTMAQTLAESPAILRNILERNGRTDRIPEAQDNRSKSTLFADLAAAVRSYFRDLGDLQSKPPKSMDGILGRMNSRRDAVVNFNWDEEVDVALCRGRRVGVSYTFEAWFHKQETILNLKPHGSTGWYDVKQGIGNPDQYFIADEDHRIPRPQKRIVAFDELGLPCDIDKKLHGALECPPVLTAPTFAKRFDFLEQQAIWQDVIQICSNATEFVFLGYSIPKDDFLTRAAIRSALHVGQRRKKSTCLIVDRSLDASKLANFQSIFGNGLSEKHNFLFAQFGQGHRDVSSDLHNRLSNAHVR